MGSPILLTNQVLPLLQAAVAWDRRRLAALERRSGSTAQTLQPVMEEIERLHRRALEVAGAGVLGLAEAVEIVAGSARFSKEINSIMDHAASVASAVEEMAQSADEVASHAQEAAGRAEVNSRKSEEGNVAISGLMGDVDLLEQAVRSMAEGVHQFVGFAGEINRLTAIVRDIAHQTNLLALNAAIEAARAGEAGRGFAVVADEVKKLADKTAEATAEIERVTATMNELSERVGESVSSSLERLGKSVDALEVVASVLGENTAAVQDVSQRVAQIAQAAAEQRSVARDMAARLNEITASLTAEAQQVHGIVGSARGLVSRLERQFAALAEDAPDRLLLEVVKADHLLWKLRLALLLHGELEIAEGELKDHTQCRLGRWYYGTGGSRYGTLAAFREMEGPHQRVHALAREIWSLAQAQRIEDALEKLQQMDGLSTELIGLLDRLGAEVEGAEDAAEG